MANTFEQIEELIRSYSFCVAAYWGADTDEAIEKTGERMDEKWAVLRVALEPIIADAQRYRSLQGKTDEQA